jgi:hypothetical protein
LECSLSFSIQGLARGAVDTATAEPAQQRTTRSCGTAVTMEATRADGAFPRGITAAMRSDDLFCVALRRSLCNTVSSPGGACPPDSKCIEVLASKELEQSDICCAMCARSGSSLFLKLSDVYTQMERRDETWIIHTSVDGTSAGRSQAELSKRDMKVAKWNVTAVSYLNEFYFYKLLMGEDNAYRSKVRDSPARFVQAGLYQCKNYVCICSLSGMELPFRACWSPRSSPLPCAPPQTYPRHPNCPASS